VIVYDGLLDQLKRSAIGQTVTNPASAIEWLQINSTVGPTIRVTDPFKKPIPAPPGKPGIPAGAPMPGGAGGTPPGAKKEPLLGLLRPKLTVKVKGVTAQKIAPWGEPGGTWWPAILALSAFGGGSLVWLLFRGAKTLWARR